MSQVWHKALAATSLLFAVQLACAQSQDDSTLTPSQTQSQPALVRPPDVLTEESPVKAESNEPIPQIKKKKVDIDASFRPESRFIEHPASAKGLIKIDKERVYHYKVKTSDSTSLGMFHIGSYQPLELSNPNNPDLTFEDMYDRASYPILFYDHEKYFWRKFGQLGLRTGGGFYYAQGKGQFAETNPDPEGPAEKFTLFIFPLTAGLVYRFKYYDFQWVVPYAEGGIDIFAFAERRDDDLNPRLGAAFGAAPAGHASGGVSILLGRNSSSFLDLDREYGINMVYLTAEFRQYFALSNKYDFSGSAITGGLSAEY